MPNPRSCLVSLLIAAIATAVSLPAQTPPAVAAVTLKDAYQGVFHVGVALKPSQFEEEDARGAALVLKEFDSITPENVLKWEWTEPQNGKFNFAPGDAYVRFGQEHHLWIIGHNLCWHNQLPDWVSEPEPGQKSLTREVLLERLRRHIQTVARRYQGRIDGWDVVNEAVGENGDYRDSVFYRVIGKEFIPLAFKWAHEADPHAELYYNDYNLDLDTAKRDGAVRLIKYLREQGAPIDGIGLQGHYNLRYPSTKRIDETIKIFGAMGLKVMITELDVETVANRGVTGAVGARRDWNAQPKTLTEKEQQALAKRYGDLFRVFVANRNVITRVTLWGLRDADSWRRYASPLLFDDNYQPKPAYAAVIAAAPAK